MMITATLFRTISWIAPLQYITLTHAWGSEGHAIIANIAYNRLSHETKGVITDILFPDGDYNYTAHGFASPMAAVASWADSARYTKEYSWTESLHYVDVEDLSITGGCPSTPLSSSLLQQQQQQRKQLNATTTVDMDVDVTDSCVFDYDRDCSKGGKCAVTAVTDFSTNLIKGLSMSRSEGHSLPNQHLSTTATTTMATTRFLRGGDGKQRERKIYQNDHNTSSIGILDSLKFLIHIIGDVHQPLHVSRGSDKGGNTIRVSFRQGLVQSDVDHGRTGELQKSGWNLHSVWDTGIIHKAMKTFFNNSQDTFQKDVERLLQNDDDVNTWLSCADGHNLECVSSWAKESFHDALTWAYADENGHEIENGAVLSEDYFLTRLGTVERRLAAGGVRLAASLESIFDRVVF